MGCFNSLMAARHGYEALVYDCSQGKLETFRQRLSKLSEAILISQQGMDNECVEDILTRIQTVSDLEQIGAQAGLISESVFEDVQVKRNILRTIDQICPAPTIITTNTSSISISDLETALDSADRFAGLHSHLYSRLFDIGAGRLTSPQVIDQLRWYVQSLNGFPVILKADKSGYCYNTMIDGLFAAAIILSTDFGICFFDIDRAWMTKTDSLLGPFGMMDGVGLNVIYDSTYDEGLPDKFQREMDNRKDKLVKPYCANNALGIKSGKGFYSYPNPEYQTSEFRRSALPNDRAYQILLLGMIYRAVCLVADRSIAPADIDRIWMLGQNASIGPFGLLDKFGLDVFMEMLMGKKVKNILPPFGFEQIHEFMKPYLEKKEFGAASGKGIYYYPSPDYQKNDFTMRLGYI